MENKNEEYLKELGNILDDICYYGFRGNWYVLNSEIQPNDIEQEKELFIKLKSGFLEARKDLKERVEKISKVLVEKEEKKEKVVPLTDNEKFEKWIERTKNNLNHEEFEKLTKEIPISLFTDYIGKKGIESFTYNSDNKCFILTAKIKDQLFETKFNLSNALTPKYFLQGMKNTVQCINASKKEVE